MGSIASLARVRFVNTSNDLDRVLHPPSSCHYTDRDAIDEEGNLGQCSRTLDISHICGPSDFDSNEIDLTTKRKYSTFGARLSRQTLTDTISTRDGRQ